VLPIRWGCSADISPDSTASYLASWGHFPPRFLGFDLLPLLIKKQMAEMLIF